jgi:hypothetical protein
MSLSDAFKYFSAHVRLLRSDTQADLKIETGMMIARSKAILKPAFTIQDFSIRFCNFLKFPRERSILILRIKYDRTSNIKSSIR